MRKKEIGALPMELITFSTSLFPNYSSLSID